MCDNVLATDPLKFDEPKVLTTIPKQVGINCFAFDFHIPDFSLYISFVI